MNQSPDKYSQIPLNNLASNIFHGPYPAAPQELINHYIETRDIRLVPGSTSDEQLITDTESEWQYDQHANAVMEALEADSITSEHALYMLEKVLRPWFIGRRNE
jgi:hypothetical protein